MAKMAGTLNSISTNITMRPPNLSVQMPIGTRINEPESTGNAAKKPNSVSLSPSCFLIGMPTTASIIQIIKHTVNDTVLDTKTA